MPYSSSSLANWNGEFSPSPTKSSPRVPAPHTQQSPQAINSNAMSTFRPPGNAETSLSSRQDLNDGYDMQLLPPFSQEHLITSMASPSGSDSDNDSDRVNDMLVVTSPERPTPSATPQVCFSISAMNAINASKRVWCSLQNTEKLGWVESGQSDRTGFVSVCSYVHRLSAHFHVLQPKSSPSYAIPSTTHAANASSMPIDTHHSQVCRCPLFILLILSTM